MFVGPQVYRESFHSQALSCCSDSQCAVALTDAAQVWRFRPGATIICKPADETTFARTDASAPGIGSRLPSKARNPDGSGPCAQVENQPHIGVCLVQRRARLYTYEAEAESDAHTPQTYHRIEVKKILKTRPWSASLPRQVHSKWKDPDAFVPSGTPRATRHPQRAARHALATCAAAPSHAVRSSDVVVECLAAFEQQSYAAYTQSMHSLYTAYAQPIHSLYTAYTQPIHSLYTD